MIRAHVRLFGIPVRFDPTFLILSAGLGYLMFLSGDDPDGTAMFFVWIPLVGLAVLAHELGHALVGRLFGLTPFVILHGMGGLTSFPAEAHRGLSHGKRVLITLAGPIAGVAVGVAAYLLERFGGFAVDSVPQRALILFFWVTAGWGALNLLPILPLDGGHVVATVLDRVFGPRGVQLMRGFSALAGLAIAAWAALASEWLLAGLGALAAVANIRAYRRGAPPPLPPAGPILDAGFAALAADQPEAAARIVDHLDEKLTTDDDRARHAHLAAWVALFGGDPGAARAALAKLPEGARPDAYLEGKIRLALGDPAGAIAPLLEALLDRREDEIAEALGEAMAAAHDASALLALLADDARAHELGERLARAVASRVDDPAVGVAVEARFPSAP